MIRVMYSSDGESWWRTEWQPQCKDEVLMSGQCQGTLGHEGNHWCYRPDGSYAWDNPGPDGGCGWTPAGHNDYRTPEVMQEFHYLRFRTCEEVNDPGVITRLEQDDPPEGMENCSINKPLAEDDPFYEEAQRRLESYRERRDEI